MTFQDILISMTISKQAELEAKGFSTQQAEGAIRRAKNWAQRIASKVSPDIEERVFIDLYRSQLLECESWLSKTMEAMTANSAI